MHAERQIISPPMNTLSPPVPNSKYTFQVALVQQEVSCSHWGLFCQQHEITTPPGYRFANRRALERELTRPDGIIEIVAV